MYHLRKEQWVDVPKSEIWDFFSNPANLLKITPREMKMKILEAEPRKMYSGMILRYRVSPLFGIGLSWTSLISAVEEKSYFVDQMIEGPFKLWHHLHRFEEEKGGTLIIDDLHYKIPLEPFSKVLHPFLVAKELEKMFQHREVVVKEIFGRA